MYFEKIIKNHRKMTFKYQKPFPILKDDTKYNLLTKDFVSTINVDGREVLKVEPEGLELLAKAAFTDVSFYLRTAHLEKLAKILEDPEATDNDRFVAHTMLMNQTVSAEGRIANLPRYGRGNRCWEKRRKCFYRRKRCQIFIERDF